MHTSTSNSKQNGLPTLNLQKVKHSLDGVGHILPDNFDVGSGSNTARQKHSVRPPGSSGSQMGSLTGTSRKHKAMQGLHNSGLAPNVDEPQTARPPRTTSQQKAQTPRAQPLTARPSTLKTPNGRNPSVESDRSSSGQGHAGAQQVSLPMTPATALKLHRDTLTEYEQSEVLEYPQIWYTGAGAQKVRGSPVAGTQNHGYDDDRGDYTIVPHDHFAYRFEIIQILGKGSFGQVMRCFDYKTQTMKAVKVIRNKKRFHHQALVEVKILEHLRHKDPEDNNSIVHMHEYFYFRNHLCISFELLSINLYEFIKNNNFQGLSLGLIRRFAQQLLVSLKFLRKQRVIHCDLKPENILLRQPNKSVIKVIDFGSSCFEDERVYTYIQSRFYRSPEVILGLPYDVGIDMWSFGCILAELYTGYPLFPGENEVEQLACIMEIMGLPPKRVLDEATRKKMFFDSSGAPRLVPNSRGKKRRPGAKDLPSALRCSDALFVNFLDGCLQWDSRERFNPDDALAHEWITENAPPPQSHRVYGHSSSGQHGPAPPAHHPAHSLAPAKKLMGSSKYHQPHAPASSHPHQVGGSHGHHRQQPELHLGPYAGGASGTGMYAGAGAANAHHGMSHGGGAYTERGAYRQQGAAAYGDKSLFPPLRYGRK